MNSNPYKPSAGNLGPLPRSTHAPWLSHIKRGGVWMVGFIVLFAINAFVELFVLPHWGLENTRKNDLYFICWWIAVGSWLVLGLPIVGAASRRATTDGEVESKSTEV